MSGVKRILMFITIMVFAASPAWSQSLGEGSKSGAISGRVTVNGAPARGISVMAFYHEKGKDERLMFQLLFGGGGDFIFKTVSDVNGQFRFSELRAGEYELFVAAPAMVGSRGPNPAAAKPREPAAKDKKDDDDEDDEEDDENSIKGAGSNDSAQKKVILTDGQTVDNLEFSITRGGVITGRVTYADGRPVIGESVSINKKQSNNDKNEYSLSLDASMVGMRFTTDDRGIYRIYGVPEGRYQVSIDFRPDPVMGERFLAKRPNHQPTFYPGVTDPAAAQEVEVTGSNEVSGIDIKIGAPSKSYTVAGRIIDAETGKPVPGIAIHYAPVGGSGLSGKSQNSNPRGQFKLEGLTSGAYAAYASSDFDEENEYYGDTTNFEVKDANLNNFDIKMHRGLTVSGRVVVEGESSAGPANLTEQMIFAMTWEEAAGAAKDASHYSRAMARVNPDGSFTIKGLRPGNARLMVNSYGQERGSFALKRIERGGANVTAGFEVRRGEIINDMVVVLARANCAVIGKVNIQGGSLPKNAQIYVSAHKPGAKEGEDDSDGFGAGITGSSGVEKDGSFKIENLVTGQYEVVVTVNLGFNEKDGTPKTREVKQVINLSEGQQLEVELLVDLSNLND
jgi:hypothetical protein